MKKFITKSYMYTIIIICLTACNISYMDKQEESIKDIHSVKPFASNIYHGKNYRFPEGSCNQTECHNSGLKGSESVSSCFLCHDDQWSVFSTTHTRNINKYYHHKDLANGDFSSTCGINSYCHSTDLTGSTGYNFRHSCYTCHDPIPTPGHTINIDGYYHYKDLYSGNYTAVYGDSSCHGSDLTGSAGNGPSCYNCHDPIPSSKHIVNKDGVLHEINIGKDPQLYCYKSGCHGSSEPGGMCDKSGCHGSPYPEDD